MRFDSQITFFYYKDLTEPAKFYEEIMGFELEIDQGWAKTALLTLVTSTVEEVDEWYEKLKKKGVKLLTEPTTHEAIQVRGFFFEDPAGYKIEIQYFL